MRLELILIVLLVIISLTAFGCQVSDRGIEEFKKEGYEELDVLREEGASYFPREAYQGQTFNLDLVLKNKAAYDAKDVRVLLVGFDSAFVSLILGEEYRDIIGGRSIFNPEGEFADFRFQGQVNDLQGKKSEPQNYFFYLNYASTLDFTPKPCVGPRPKYKGINTNECELLPDQIRFNGQGAPLAVETMEVIPPFSEGGEIEFRMKLNNRGKGKVGKVRLERATMVNEEMDCFFRGKSANIKEIFFPENEEAELICRKNLETQNRYTSALVISLSYDYQRIIPLSLELRS